MAREADPGTAFLLPALMTGPGDVNRALLELESLDEFLRQAALRKSGDAALKLPKMSRVMDELAALNKANLLLEADRQRLAAFLEALKKRAPVLHISFASEPSAAFTVKIVSWLRQNISKYALVQVGLQPSIAAGCVVRTTNKTFDFSLRRNLKQQRQALLDAIDAVSNRSAQPVPGADNER